MPPYRPEPERRIDGHWHVNKQVPAALIFTMLVQFAMSIWFIADMRKDLDVQKENMLTFRTDVKELSQKIDQLLLAQARQIGQGQARETNGGNPVNGNRPGRN